MAIVKLVVRLVNILSLGRVRGKPCRVMARLVQILQDTSASVASTAQLAGVIIHVSEMHCNVKRHV